MDKFKKGDRVIFNLKDIHISNWEDCGFEKYEILKHENQEAVIYCEVCYNYYDIIFEDGFIMDAVSDYHFTLV